MVCVAILGFVIVTILGTFSHQQMVTRKLNDKNAAVRMADAKLQELLKFNPLQLRAYAIGLPNRGVDEEYLYEEKGTFIVSKGNPMNPNQFRRIVLVEPDIVGQIATISVMVQYKLDGEPETNRYAFRVMVSARRTIDPRS